MDLKRLIKYLAGLFLFIIGISILIAGVVLNNTPMIIIGFFTFVIGTFVGLFIYMNP
jgi:hypothetical protein